MTISTEFTSLADEVLIEQYKRGVIAAFEVVYNRHKGGLYRFFLRQCASADIAEELYQDVWMKVIQSRENYKPSAKFSTYLYRIAHNRLIDYFRHINSYQYSLRVEGDHQEIVEQTASAEFMDIHIDKQRLELALKQAVKALPFEQREAFLLQQEGHLSLEDIAIITETNRETVKSRLRYAMNKLREYLEGI